MKFFFHRAIIITIIVIAINNISYAINQPIKITAGIIPIQSLVSMVIEGTNNNVNVIFSNPNMSPHGGSINVKEMKIIKDSDILILVSKNIEQIIPTININKTKVIYLDKYLSDFLNAPNLKSFKKINYNYNNPNVNIDYHFWLDTRVAKEILKIVANELGKIDTDNAKKYQDNAKKYSHRLDKLEKELQSNLSSVTGNFMVYHNAWNYFIKNNNLGKYYQGSIIANENNHSHLDTNLGAKDILSLKEYVQQTKIVCIFTEPQFDDATIKYFIQNNNIKTAVLDPIGRESYPYSEIYFSMMKKNAQQLKSCVQ